MYTFRPQTNSCHQDRVTPCWVRERCIADLHHRPFVNSTQHKIQNYMHCKILMSTQRMQTKHIIWNQNTCRLNMYGRDIWKEMYFEMHTQHHELNVWNAHQTSWAELKTWKQNVDTANILYFNTPSFVVPTTLNPAMAKTHRSRHWAKYVSSYPTSLDNKIPTTSLVLQGKFHEVPNVAPTVSRFVCVGFHWKPLLLLSSALGL